MRRFTLVPLLLSVVGCAQQDAVRSSSAAVWTVASWPTLDIASGGSLDSPNFIIASAGLLLPKGGIVIADGYNGAVRIFDASGRLVSSVRRQGGGLSDVRSQAWLGRCGADSVFVWDGAQSLITVLDRDGYIARTFHLDGAPVMIRCSWTGTYAAFTGERTVEQLGSEGWNVRDLMPVALLNASGKTIASLPEMPVGERRPLGRRTTMALAPHRLYIGTADSGYVDVYGLDGQFLGAVNVGVEPRIPTPANYKAAVEVIARAYPTADARERIRQDMLALPMPQRMAPYSGLFVDDRRVLWVVTSAPGDGATALRAISVMGDVLGDVYIPIELEVLDLWQSNILGAYYDESGDRHVAVFRIRRVVD